MELLPGDWAVHVDSINPADINSTVINYYQAEAATLFTEVLNEFLLVSFYSFLLFIYLFIYLFI